MSSIKYGTCPHCGSTKIYKSPKQKLSQHTVQTNAFGNWIYVKSDWSSLKGVTLIHYACANCQYIESYVADNAGTKLITDEWERMHPTTVKNKNQPDDGD
ncbi:MAG: hypothetical protein ACPG7F_19590 [Aggregatilineales bacterium]